MKKKFLTFILTICFILPCVFMFSACSTTTPADIEFKVENGYIQYYDGENWNNLIAVEDLKGKDGDDGVGIDGREVEFNVSSTHIQWRYVGEASWKNLIALSELEGDDGEDISANTYTVSYDYGAEFDISEMFSNYKTSQEVKSNEWISQMPQPIEEYKEEFLGWFIKDTDKQIENYDFIGGNVTLVAKWKNITFDYENCFFGYNWSLGGYECYIDKKAENVVVPSIYNDGHGMHKVLSVYSSYSDSDNASQNKLQSVQLTNFIKKIDSNAFSYCKDLTSISIPSSVINIHTRAFFGCDNLSSIDVDTNNTVYDSRNNCNAIINKQTNALMVGCKTTTIPDSVKCISSCAFAYNCGITTINITENVLEIGENAFIGCENLESVSFVNNSKLSKIGTCAFANCSRLSQIALPNSITIIDRFAFEACENLESITIPENITTINTGAFQDCSKLEVINFNATNMSDAVGGIFALAGELTTGITVNIGANVTKVPANLFAPSSISTKTNAINIRTVNFVENSICETIGEETFRSCHYLAQFIIPASLKTIGNNAFTNCYNLVEVTNLSTIKVYKGTSSNGLVGKYAKVIFTDNSQSSNITTIDNVVYYKNNESSYIALMPIKRLDCVNVNLSSLTTEINISAFEDCENLESVVIPNGVTTINNSAFRNCSKLKSISIPSSVSTIGDSAFYYCANLESITVASDNVKYIAQSNCLIEIDTKTLILGCKNSVIPTSDIVNTIGNYAFAYCEGLTNITIPANITEVGFFAFEYCNDLTGVNILEGITSIGYGMFYNCKNLTTVRIPNSVIEIERLAFSGCEKLEGLNISKNVTTISNEAFNYCKNLEITVASDNPNYSSINNCLIEKSSKTLIFGCKNSVIPTDGSVTIIGENAFWGCGELGDLIIPTSITTIENFAFINCFIDNIYYLGSQEEWNEINIVSNNDGIDDATKYFYSKSQPTGSGNYWHYDTDGITPIAW